MKNKFQIISVIAVLIGLSVACSSSNIKKSQSTFEMKNVAITKGVFHRAQEANLDYLLALDVDRLLAPYLKDAGIKPIKENYPNWESTGLDGHIGGHYLSALAYMYTATHNDELLERIDYMLGWLSKCQQKNESGYVGGVPDAKQMWEELAQGHINAGTFSLNDKWVPLYNIHKTFAGLIDVYNLLGNNDAKCILLGLSDWFYDAFSSLSDEQLQELLVSEHGALNEVFVDVFLITKNEKYLEFAKRLTDQTILEPLLNKENRLTGLHANTQIPKVIGLIKYGLVTEDEDWIDAADYFWNTIVNNWTISIGGNSVREHFHSPQDFSDMIESEQGPETCNTYNMLRLTKLLYEHNPQAKYLDFYERALYNHILSSIHPKKGGYVYFTPIRPNHYRVYSQPQTSFWCCVGTGMENPGRYAQMIYTKSGKDLYVNLFIESSLTWKEKGIALKQLTCFPKEQLADYYISAKKPTVFTLNLRAPDWMVDGSRTVLINDQEAEVEKRGDYIMINRRWKDGDRVAYRFKMKSEIESLPDSSNWVSFLYGPIVLAARNNTEDIKGLWADDSRMGHIASGKKLPISETPALVLGDIDKATELLVPILGRPLHFYLHTNDGSGSKIELQPFFQIHESRYTIYWPVFDEQSLQEERQKQEQSDQERMKLEAKTVDLVWPGEQQPESDHFIKFKNSESGVFRNKHWRHAKGFFAYQMKSVPLQNHTLRVTYYGRDSDRDFDILVDNKSIARVKLDGSSGDEFFTVDYTIEGYMLTRSTFTLKFQAREGSLTAGVYGVRLLR